jgi:hypothetical protein
MLKTEHGDVNWSEVDQNGIKWLHFMCTLMSVRNSQNQIICWQYEVLREDLMRCYWTRVYGT